MRVLLVEDDGVLARQTADALKAAGCVVDHCVDGEEAQFLGETEAYDAVVLDLGLPKQDGLLVLKHWREAGRGMPVLILTARDAWSDKVQGFRAGADDYVVKPFRVEEVVMRIRALIRRASGHGKALLHCGPLEYDTQFGSFALHGLPIKLTALETRILAYMIHHAGRPISRTELSDHVYNSDADADFNSLEVIVGRLRKKIGRSMIETVRGQGYRLAAAAEGETGDAIP